MVNQFFSTQRRFIQLTTLVTGCLLVGMLCLECSAQLTPIVTEKDSAAPSSAKPTEKPAQAKVDQVKLVRSIYELTKTTKTAKQLTAFVAQCDSVLKHDLTSKNTNYVTSLKGWALNLRGQKRMAVALQLKQIGNSQYGSVLKQSMDDFDQAIINAPDRYRSWMARGIAFAQTGEFKKAALNFTSVIKLKTDLPDGWFNRAESLYHLGRFEAAAADYETVLRLNSDDSEALTGLGHSKLAIGKTAEALAHYQAVAKLQPENTNAFVNIGDACQQLGDWKAAGDNFTKSISIKPTGVALQRSAWLKATCPDAKFRSPSEAIELANRAISLSSDTVTNLDTLAAAQAAAGEFNIAKTTQQKTIVLASAIEDVESDESVTSPYQARLTLYEAETPFTQPRAESDK